MNQARLLLIGLLSADGVMECNALVGPTRAGTLPNQADFGQNPKFA